MLTITRADPEDILQRYARSNPDTHTIIFEPGVDEYYRSNPYKINLGAITKFPNLRKVEITRNTDVTDDVILPLFQCRLNYLDLHSCKLDLYVFFVRLAESNLGASVETLILNNNSLERDKNFFPHDPDFYLDQYGIGDDNKYFDEVAKFYEMKQPRNEQEYEDIKQIMDVDKKLPYNFFKRKMELWSKRCVVKHLDLEYTKHALKFELTLPDEEVSRMTLPLLMPTLSYLGIAGFVVGDMVERRINQLGNLTNLTMSYIGVKNADHFVLNPKLKSLSIWTNPGGMFEGPSELKLTTPLADALSRTLIPEINMEIHEDPKNRLFHKIVSNPHILSLYLGTPLSITKESFKLFLNNDTIRYLGFDIIGNIIEPELEDRVRNHIKTNFLFYKTLDKIMHRMFWSM